MEKGQIKTEPFWSNFDNPFAPKIAEIEKNKHQCRKTSATGLSKYVKIKVLFPLPFPRKIRLIFEIFGLFLPGNRRGHKSKGQNQSLTKPISSTQFLSTSCKKHFVRTFPSFAAIDHKGYFRKILTQIFKFGYFSWYHA